MNKIVVIGAGSSYTPELIGGFIKRIDELPIDEICLYDITDGEQKLNIIHKFSKQLLENNNVNIKLSTSTNRKEALEGANYVITQLRVGGLKARINDEKISPKHGMLGQETNGPGGAFKGLRTFPVIEGIINDVNEICPDAWIINFTNPSGMVTQYVHQELDFPKFIGVCNVPVHMHMNIAELMDVKFNEVKIDFLGLNHLVYASKMYINNEEKTAEIIDVINDDSSKDISMNNISSEKWEADFLKTLGIVPCPYLKYFYKSKEFLDQSIVKYKTGTTRAEEVLAIETELFKMYDKLDVKPALEKLSMRGGAYYSDTACALVKTIHNNDNEEHYIGYINNGALEGIDQNDVVEATFTFDGTKFVPVKRTTKLPTSVIGLVQHMKSFEKAMIKSHLSGKREDIIVGLMANPLTNSDVNTAKIVDEMMEVHKKYLPQFD